MEKIIWKMIRWFIFFARNAWGALNTPYVTYRKLASGKSDLGQTIYIFILVFAYFAFAGLVRIGMNHPLLLTLKFNALVLSSGIGFVMMILIFLALGRLLKTEGDLKTLCLLWSFSLLPTTIWFFITSILYLVIPPPRTLSYPGKIFSLVFISFSIGIFLWKAILYYLTLRFGLKLDLLRIFLVSGFVFLYIAFYSVSMYRLDIFRVPFI